jgi:hypothetical protein
MMPLSYLHLMTPSPRSGNCPFEVRRIEHATATSGLANFVTIAGEPAGAEAARVVPHEVLAGRNWQNIPVRNHPRPVGLHYASDNVLYIAFFAKIEYV